MLLRNERNRHTKTRVVETQVYETLAFPSSQPPSSTNASSLVLKENEFPSIIIPVFNEEKTIVEIVTRVVELPFRKEVVVVDDGSNDSTSKLLRRWQHSPDVRVLTHETNLGKGSAIRSGIDVSTGNFTVIQDADLEYSPEDLHRVLEPLCRGDADVVYGSRYSAQASRHPHFVSRYGVRLLNHLVWCLYRVRLTDQATCYKAFRSDILKRMDLQCRKFEFCAEVTAKACRMKLPIMEVPIGYDPRGYSDGKKIRTRDGLQCAASLFRYCRWKESPNHAATDRFRHALPVAG